MKNIVFILLIVVIVTLSGCYRYSPPLLQSKTKDIFAKKFVVPDIKTGLIYIYIDKDASFIIPIMVNGGEVGVLDSLTYLSIKAPVGNYTISANCACIPTGVEVDGGDLHFVKLTSGWSESDFSKISTEIGSAEIKKRKLAKFFPRISNNQLD
jgi:hypothetical protein